MEGSARAAAFDALARVGRGVPVADAVDEASRRAQLTREDRRLATQLTYGVLRHRSLLDYWIARRTTSRLEPAVANVLRLAFFQAAFLDRIPEYALVSSAVEQAKRVAPAAQGLVNAVLRRRLDDRPLPEDLATRYSHPTWLVERWQRRWPADVEELLRAANRVPPLTLRVSPDWSRDELLADLARRQVAAEASPLVPEAIRVNGSLWLEDWDAFAEGGVTVQDESSMLTAHVLAPPPDAVVLDLAAGVGGKTCHILQRWPTVTAVAWDQDGRRLDRLMANARRLGVANRVRVHEGDGRQLTPGEAGTFDAVVLDAPCSGLGVLRRRVDARWRRRETDLRRHQTLQLELLEAAWRVVATGGPVVYSTCSVEPEETAEVLAHFRRRHPEARPDPVGPFLPSAALRRRVGAAALTWRPSEDRLDGFFVARFMKDVPGGGARA
ncbi:MAG: 16S rRNA (cytosine(967)-C(5))-methyltransferase RsmB [Thermaerobacter sp.]|nr:16S rRNA (cytosine(967)-C(5))-methyltransferase RsmB [Thermaerobacter sp.]